LAPRLAITAECSLRFKRPVTPGRNYTAIAGINEIHKRKITAQADFLDPDGKIAVEATATFLPIKGRMPVQ